MKNDMLWYVYHIQCTSTEEITDFVPKCLVILVRIKYMYIVIEQENCCLTFNIQIQ
jgi:hypothetical protein